MQAEQLILRELSSGPKQFYEMLSVFKRCKGINFELRLYKTLERLERRNLIKRKKLFLQKENYLITYYRLQLNNLASDNKTYCIQTSCKDECNPNDGLKNIKPLK